MRGTLASIGHFCLLLYLFVLIFTILGMELFAFKVMFDTDGRPINIEEATEQQLLEGVYP
jgi:hypothetical protein